MTTLSFAKLFYGGSRGIDVTVSEGIPIPGKFDFKNAEKCAREIFAMVSNASGGHILRGCKVQINQKIGSVNLTAVGAHVYYTNPKAPKVSIVNEAEALAYVKEIQENTVTIELGSVVTDQYGDGWKRARWA